MSLLSTKVANTLKLPRSPIHITFSGVQDSRSTLSHALVTLNMCPVQDPDNSFQISAAVVARVTCILPLQGATGVKELPHIKELQLADPNFHSPGRIALLLGEDILNKLLNPPEMRMGAEGTPSAWKTVFGWATRGPFTPDASVQTIQAASHVTIPTVVEATEKALTRFWETEEPPNMETVFNPEEQYVQTHYANHHSFLPSLGRYEVTLPQEA